MGFNTMVIIIASLTLAYLIYQEYKRTNKHWLVWRLITALTLVISLVLLVIPIHYLKQITQTKNELLLVAQGFNSDSLTSGGLHFYSDPALKDQLKTNAKFIPDLAYYLAENPAIKQIKVYGNGLTADELKNLGGVQLALYPSNPNGIIECNWTSKIVQDELFHIQGIYANSSRNSIFLKLMGYGKVLDSIKIPARSSTPFALSHQIKQTGKAIFHLVALNGRDTLSVEPIPIQSETKNTLQILMLASSPTFENKFLKKWLYENGYPLAFRSQISKGKYSTDFLNQTAEDVNQIQAATLKNKAVLIIDQTAFENLVPSERNAVNNAISQGLGLVLLADGEKSNQSLLKDIGILKSTSEQKKLDLISSRDGAKLQTLETGQQLFIRAKQDQQILFKDNHGNAVATQQLYGAGRIAATTLQGSYEWMLAGKPADYASYWSTLISAVARKQSSPLNVDLVTSIPQLNEKLSFQISTADANIPDVVLDKQTLPIKQNALFPNQWLMQTWLAKAGWNDLRVNGKIFSFYVFSDHDWKTLRANRTQNLNQAYIQKQLAKAVPSEHATLYEQVTLSKWYFLILLVFAASFLWFENRIYNTN